MVAQPEGGPKWLWVKFSRNVLIQSETVLAIVSGASDGTRTRGLLRDRRSHQLNYALTYSYLRMDCSLPVPSDTVSHFPVPFYRAVQCRVPPTESQIFSPTSSSDTAFFSADPDTKHICIASNLCKALAQPLALTFPDTSLFIKVVRILERKNR